MLTASDLSEVPGLLSALDDATTSGKYVAGYLAYEAGYAFVDLDLPDDMKSEAPLAWFGVYDAPVSVAPPDVDAAFAGLGASVRVSDVRFDVSREDYERRIDTVRHHIREGDVYQVNVTGPVRFQAHGDPLALYRRLRDRQHVSYGAFLNTGERHVLSLSPELFFERDGADVVTRPMKGTIHRGRTLDEDRALRDALASDEKNRAENLMIVDLLRNDLSVCCTPGSVRVPALYDTETYDTVTQMTSTVRGTLRNGQGLSDIMRALFPCGSITGAPKRRAMQVIADVEASPRSVYCGTVGYAGPNGVASFNVAIRTALLDRVESGSSDADNDTSVYNGTLGIGSGVVWDSDPASEYDECRLKARFLTGTSSRDGFDDGAPSGPDASFPDTAGDGQADADDPVLTSPYVSRAPGRTATGGAFRLIETMRFDGVMIPLLDRHVARLERSATYFGMAFDEAHVRGAIQDVLSGRDMETLLRVRLTMDRWGRVDLETHPIERESATPWTCVIASKRVDSNNRFLYHKTTRRDVYERAGAEARAAGADEALLFNHRGELTEGARSNVFVKKGGRYWTPPVRCGLLQGVYRDHVLDTVDASGERVLTMDDLTSADALFCCNGVRGWRPATLRLGDESD